MNTTANRAWNLVADIGGTNARFGLEDYYSSQLQLVRRYSVSECREFTDAVGRFLQDVAAAGGWQSRPQTACLAVACAVENDVLQFTNSAWTIDRRQIGEMLGSIHVELINDFAAVGYAIADLSPGDWHQVGGRAPSPGRPIAVLGPGTGLGVCSLVPIGAGYKVIEGEGGHVDFAPRSAREVAVLEILAAQFGRVSVERLLSGAGILNIYRALAQTAQATPVHDTPEAITRAAMAGEDALSGEALELFCEVLGATAGNLALTLGARGGVYFAGGILPRFIDFLRNSGFRDSFEAKGRFRSYLVDIPTRVVVKPDLGLLGAARKLKLAE